MKVPSPTALCPYRTGQVNTQGKSRNRGGLDHQKVRAAYRRADLLLFPTRLEGLPLVALEAIACGTPVVAANATSLPEVIEPHSTGLLCRQDAPNDFAAAIRHLSTQPDTVRTMGLAARSAAESRFSLTHMALDYANLLGGLVEGRTR